MAFKAKQAIFHGSANGARTPNSPPGSQPNPGESQFNAQLVATSTPQETGTAPSLPARNRAQPQTESVSPPPLPSRQSIMPQNTQPTSPPHHCAPSLPSRNTAAPIPTSLSPACPRKASSRPPLSPTPTEQAPPLPSRHGVAAQTAAPHSRAPVHSPPAVHGITHSPGARPSVHHGSRNMALPQLPTEAVIRPPAIRSLPAEPKPVPSRNIAQQPPTRPQKAVPPIPHEAVTSVMQTPVQASQTDTTRSCPSQSAKDLPQTPAPPVHISPPHIQQPGQPLPSFTIATQRSALAQSRARPTATAVVTATDERVPQSSEHNDNKAQHTSTVLSDDLESRFTFHDVNKCPAPGEFKAGPKTYASKSRRAETSEPPLHDVHSEPRSEAEHDTHQNDDTAIHTGHRLHQLETALAAMRRGRLPGVSLSPPAAEQDEILHPKKTSPQSVTRLQEQGQSEPLSPQSQHLRDSLSGHGTLRNPRRDPLPPPPPPSLDNADDVPSDTSVTRARGGAIKTSVTNNTMEVCADPADTSDMGSPGDKDPDYTHIVCPICMDRRREIATAGGQLASTPCGHVFCLMCITAAITSQGRCPTCRKKINQKQIITLYM